MLPISYALEKGHTFRIFLLISERGCDMKDCPEHRLHKHLLDRHEKKIDRMIRRLSELRSGQHRLFQSIEGICKRLERIESNVEESKNRPSAIVDAWKTAFIVAIASAIISVLLKIIDTQ